MKPIVLVKRACIKKVYLIQYKVICSATNTLHSSLNTALIIPMSKCSRAELEAHSEAAKTFFFPPLQTINGDSEFISNDVTEEV